jgi:ABC-type lipoprotein release transport system permease subunit
VHRQREASIRLAIGATRARLVRLFVTKGLVLSPGIGRGRFAVRLAVQSVDRFTMPVEVPFCIQPELNWRIAVYSVAVVIATALCCGLAPALKAARATVCLSAACATFRQRIRRSTSIIT